MSDEAALRWKTIFTSAVDGIVVIDARGRIEAFNPAAERLFGYREAEIIGQNVKVLMPAPYRDEHDAYLGTYLETGKQGVIGRGREVTGRRRDGSTFPLHLSVAEMELDGARKFTGILHDLSERVQMEEQLREQAALARLGEMAAVVAHEVKNPLAGVRAAVQVLARRLPPDSYDAGVADQIISRVDALNGLMKDLLLYARPPEPRLMPVDVASIVASTADLLRGDPALQNVRIQVSGSAGPVVADAELLQIVCLNVMVNGGQAMAGEGTLQIGLSRSARSCEIAFTDSGPGIPLDVRSRIFTPFFTTKRRGAGLGLSTAKRLVEAHRGTITVDCPTSGGTTVTVQLPVG